MCNYLYYWVTVRNSQSYWHLEHMGEHWHVHGAGGQGKGGGASGPSVRCRGWQHVGTRGGGGGAGGVAVCGGVRSGIFFDIRRYCIVFVCLFFVVFFFQTFFLFTSKSCISLFYSFGLWRIIVKNNTSCCECTSNNQTSIVLLCHNVQYIFIYL